MVESQLLYRNDGARRSLFYNHHSSKRFRKNHQGALVRSNNIYTHEVSLYEFIFEMITNLEKI